MRRAPSPYSPPIPNPAWETSARTRTPLASWRNSLDPRTWRVNRARAALTLASICCAVLAWETPGHITPRRRRTHAAPLRTRWNPLDLTPPAPSRGRPLLCAARPVRHQSTPHDPDRSRKDTEHTPDAARTLYPGGTPPGEEPHQPQHDHSTHEGDENGPDVYARRAHVPKVAEDPPSYDGAHDSNHQVPEEPSGPLTRNDHPCQPACDESHHDPRQNTHDSL